ncbi:MAG: hypothetical protein HGA87_08045, partial [Desulfobulbaceae bacterium]|nr:hypothetical protein [Desulfobulbaceae bacterium]
MSSVCWPRNATTTVEPPTERTKGFPRQIEEEENRDAEQGQFHHREEAAEGEPGLVGSDRGVGQESPTGDGQVGPSEPDEQNGKQHHHQE